MKTQRSKKSRLQELLDGTIHESEWKISSEDSPNDQISAFKMVAHYTDEAIFAVLADEQEWKDFETFLSCKIKDFRSLEDLYKYGSKPNANGDSFSQQEPIDRWWPHATMGIKYRIRDDCLKSKTIEELLTSSFYIYREVALLPRS